MTLLIACATGLYLFALWKWVFSQVHLDAARGARLWKDDGKLTYWWHFFFELIEASLVRLLYFHLAVVVLGAICYGAYLLLDSFEPDKLDVVIFLLILLIAIVVGKRG